MFKKAVVVSVILATCAGNAFAWGLPAALSGSSSATETVDVSGLTAKAEKLNGIVVDANEKLGLGLVDVFNLTGKTAEAEKLSAAIKTLRSNPKEENKNFMETLDAAFAAEEKNPLKTALKSSAKSAAASTTVGSAVLNLQGAIEADTSAIKESKGLAPEIAKGIKTVSANPTMLGSLPDLKSASDTVSFVADSVPRQLQHATTLMKELRDYAKKNKIALK